MAQFESPWISDELAKEEAVIESRIEDVAEKGLETQNE